MICFFKIFARFSLPFSLSSIQKIPRIFPSWKKNIYILSRARGNKRRVGRVGTWVIRKLFRRYVRKGSSHVRYIGRTRTVHGSVNERMFRNGRKQPCLLRRLSYATRSMHVPYNYNRPGGVRRRTSTASLTRQITFSRVTPYSHSRDFSFYRRFGSGRWDRRFLARRLFLFTAIVGGERDVTQHSARVDE